MTMTVQPFKNEQAAAPLVNNQVASPATTRVAQQLPQLSRLPSSDGDKASGYAGAKDVLSGATAAPAKDVAIRLTALQEDASARSLQAQAVRTSKAVEEKMESMQEKMNEIVNSYPPFLRGSEKRQQYLMSISSIRQQIEAMTLPPNKANQPELDAASNGEAKKMWKNLFQKMELPILDANGPNEASDAQIREASSTIGTMQSELSGRRVALEQQLTTSPALISPSVAQFISQAAGQGLAQTGLSLTANLTGTLKSL